MEKGVKEGGKKEAVQCERAASTVTKQQSNKSALALRNVNPCRAILISRQRRGSREKKSEFNFFF